MRSTAKSEHIRRGLTRDRRAFLEDYVVDAPLGFQEHRRIGGRIVEPHSQFESILQPFLRLPVEMERGRIEIQTPHRVTPVLAGSSMLVAFQIGANEAAN